MEESLYWIALFSDQSWVVKNPETFITDFEDETTGEFHFYDNLYSERFSPASSSYGGFSDSDGTLEEIWYEADTLLPKKRLEFGVRRDSTTYLSEVFLAEYDLPLVGDWFNGSCQQH